MSYLNISHLSHPFLPLPLKLVFGPLRTDGPISKGARIFCNLSNKMASHDLLLFNPRMLKDLCRHSRLRSSNITRPCQITLCSSNNLNPKWKIKASPELVQDLGLPVSTLHLFRVCDSTNNPLQVDQAETSPIYQQFSIDPDRPNAHVLGY